MRGIRTLGVALMAMLLTTVPGTLAGTQNLTILPQHLATVCAPNATVDARYSAFVTPPGADGVFLMKQADLNKYKAAISAGNTTAKIVGFSALSCQNPAVLNCTRGTDAKRKLVEVNSIPCLVIRNLGRTSLTAMVSIEFDANSPLIDPRLSPAAAAAARAKALASADATTTLGASPSPTAAGGDVPTESSSSSFSPSLLHPILLLSMVAALV